MALLAVVAKLALLAVVAMIATATAFEETEEFPKRWVLVLWRQEREEESGAGR